jgi:hypothetical protein
MALRWQIEQFHRETKLPVLRAVRVVWLVFNVLISVVSVVLSWSADYISSQRRAPALKMQLA